jgi:hypothetical protein
MIATAAVAALAALGSSSTQAAEHSISTDLRWLALGVCRGPTGLVDLRRVSFLTNRSILWKISGKLTRVSVEEESLHVAEIKENIEQGITIRDSAYEISPDSDIDIDLSLAILDGELVVYWRETFKHRRYRQGVMRVSERPISSLCEGSGGIG